MVETDFSLVGMGSFAVSSTVVAAFEVGGGGSEGSEEVCSALVVEAGSEGRLPTGGREDSSSGVVEETSGTKGNEGRNSDGMDSGVIPDRFKGGKEGRGGKPGCITSGNPAPGINCGAGRLRLERFARLGNPAGKGTRPGKVAAGLTGGTEVMVWLTFGGNNGTVGTPVLRTLLTAEGVELIESPDRPCSIPVVPGGDTGEGFTDDNWTSVKPSLRGVIGVLVICPGREIFFPSSNGLVGIRCK